MPSFTTNRNTSNITNSSNSSQRTTTTAISTTKLHLRCSADPRSFLYGTFLSMMPDIAAVMSLKYLNELQAKARKPRLMSHLHSQLENSGEC